MYSELTPEFPKLSLCIDQETMVLEISYLIRFLTGMKEILSSYIQVSTGVWAGGASQYRCLLPA